MNEDYDELHENTIRNDKENEELDKDHYNNPLTEDELKIFKHALFGNITCENSRSVKNIVSFSFILCTVC